VKVGVVGSGDVGKRLAGGFASRGHEVILGTRKPDNPELKKWAASVKGKGKVTLGSFADAARQGQLVVLAVNGGAALEALDGAGKDNLSGKVLIDVTNPLDFSKGMPPSLLVGTTDSNAERIQHAVPSAKVVKAFNTVGNGQMVDPHVKGQPRLEMLIAGNDAAAKKQVTEILQSFGWAGALDVGGIEGARWLEALVPLWVRVSEPLHTYSHVFVVARD
jgi:8-hydroxy-5-deazaflavin:NADPH oxidoreductase